MSEDTRSDEQQAKADAEASKQEKKYSKAELDEVIAERDKAKEKLRKIDEDRKKLEEQKLIDEGKTKELLAQREAELAEAKKQASEYEAYKTQKREALLSKLSDDDKEFVDGMSLDKLERFVEKQTNSPKPSSAPVYKPGGTVPRPKFKNAAEFNKWLSDNNLASQ